MKILVPIKSVANPHDDVAVEAAMHLREVVPDATVVAVAVGGESAARTTGIKPMAKWPSAGSAPESLLAALSRGADQAIHVLIDDLTDDPAVVCGLLAAVCRRENPDLILISGHSRDGFGQTGPRLAGELGLPQATEAVALALTDGTITVTTDRYEIALDLPALVTVSPKLNEPHIIPLKAIVDARAKTTERITASELGPVRQSGVKMVNVEKPAERKETRMASSVSELVTLLREEARVI